MKKTVVLSLLLVLFTLSAIASEKKIYWLELTAMNVRPTNCDWSGWKYCDLDACLDLDCANLWIYSPTLQMFDFVRVLNINSEKLLPSFKIICRDRNFRVCEITIWMDFTGKSYLNVKYSDGEYKYLIK